METESIVKDYINFKETNLFGRYITLNNIEPIINKLNNNYEISIIGRSFLDRPIYSIKIGKGKQKVLIWTQMHGNESTGTKAIFDFISFINASRNENTIKKLLDKITFLIIPILNPDGAEKYSRFNAQDIDLNRDAVFLNAPESQLLRNILNNFKPDYCFNLHDQRTLFSVGANNLPATISLLAPSENEDRTITPTRIKTMQVVATIYNELKRFIPNQISRYTDEFYPNATGDNFLKEGYPTILIEAGHCLNDYQRELTRKYNFIALISGFYSIIRVSDNNYSDYFSIPENKKEFFDLIYNNVFIKNEKKNVGVRYKEKLIDKKIHFIGEFKLLKTIKDLGFNSLINKKLEFNSINEFETYLTNKK
jgi:hypothetical protein